MRVHLYPPDLSIKYYSTVITLYKDLNVVKRWKMIARWQKQYHRTVPSNTLQLGPPPSTSSSSCTSVSSSLMVTFAARNHFPKAINFVFKGSLRFLPLLPTALAVGVDVALELDLVVVAVARAFDLYFFPI
ncbi:hypothetical protein CMV_026483 [Castanea mollissima]|uniref:Uncharacterized protein n=1 Tax=Castanea mollissima TaxID=60419 RepID=A0A8J4QK17_9ROSI|nr:hypothetical protein CMV_026483 [Castanea mollissima]